MGINRCVDRRRNLQLKNNSTGKEISITRRILTEFLLWKLETEVLLNLQHSSIPGVPRPARFPT